MTVENLVTKNTYLGNGATKTYPYTFFLPDNNTAFIRCYKTKVTDGTTVEVTDFTVDTDAYEVTYPVSGEALTSEYKFTIARVIPINQMLNLVNNGPFFAQDIETALDKAIIIAQQINETTARALKLDISTNDSISANIPAPVPLHSLRWNAAGTALETTMDPATVLPAAEAAKTAAETAAGNAGASETAAAGSATAAGNSKTVAETAAGNAGSSETAAAGSATAAEAAKTAAETAAGNAGASATAAAGSATAAGTSAVNASNSEAAAESSKNLAYQYKEECNNYAGYTKNEIDSRAFSFKNKIINGCFRIWQRGASFSISNTFGYTGDRWSAVLDGDGAVVSKQIFATGQTEVPNAKYYCRSVVTPVIGNGNRSRLVQKIEDLFLFSEKYVTISFYAKADAPKNIGLSLGQFTGDYPSSVFGIGGKSIALTTQWKKYTATIYLPSIVGKTLLDTSSLWLEFWFSAGSTHDTELGFTLGQQSGTFDIAQVQLEEGSITTEFEQRPLSLELMLCQRYYEKSYSLDITPATPNALDDALCQTSQGSALTYLPLSMPRYHVSKRAVPTIVLYNPVTGNVGTARSILRNADCNIYIDNYGKDGFFTMLANVTVTTGDLLKVHWTADAEL